MLTAGRGEPADAGDWFDRLEPIAKDVFVASPANYASMILTCTVQDKSKSKEIVDELSDYLNIQSLGLLIPPWADATLDVRSAGERAKHDEARAIHRKLQAVNWNFDDSDELDALSQALNRATRRNDRKERDRLSKKMAEVRAAAMVQNLERIRDEEVPPEHLDFANLIIEFKKREQSEQPSLDDYSEESVLAWEKAYEKMAREKAAKLGPYLGTMEFSSERVRYLPLYGHAFETEPGKFNISISFKDMTYGAPALVKWLTSRGCIDIKYDLNNDAAYDYLDD